MTRTTIQEKAFTIWAEIWQLADEQWPPQGVPTAWRVYEHVKNALMDTGAPEVQAIAFTDDFFQHGQSWGDLSRINNHKRPVEKLVTALLDSELVGL